MKFLFVLILALVNTCLVTTVSGDSLEQAFKNPPDSSRMWTWWWWLGDKVDKASITADLEAIKAQGMSGVTIYSVSGPGVPDKGPDYMSPEWRELFKYSLKEANRIGLGVSTMMCSGWNAGGPWIKPEHACKHHVYSQLLVSGAQSFKGVLPRPVGNDQFYRDVAIQAFPVDALKQGAVISASSSREYYPAENTADGDTNSFWVSQENKPGNTITKIKPEWLQVNFGILRSIHRVTIVPRAGYGPHSVELQVSVDGNIFTPVGSITMEPDKSAVMEVPDKPIRLFRLKIISSWSPQNLNVQVCEILIDGQPVRGRISAELLALKNVSDSYKRRGISLDSDRVESVSGKITVKTICDGPSTPWPVTDAGMEINPSKIIDLTSRCTPDGTLEWNVPIGNWMILRTGYTLTGVMTSWSSPSGVGLEADPLDPAAMDLQFANVAAPLVKDAGRLTGNTFQSLQVDSWELALPNWSKGFISDFKKFRGYDPRPYLPALTGVVVGSPEISDRFLYDYRKTLGDCVAENYFGRLSRLAKSQGLIQQSEAGGVCWPKVMAMDGLKNLGRCDIPMGEFWQDGRWLEEGQNKNGKQTSSASHLYGKNIAAAEAFTSFMHWVDSPATLKPTADRAFCEGFNRFFIFSSATRSGEGFPGTELSAGTHFNRKITWWNESHWFCEYIARCCHLLQQGKFVADVLYYNGDSCPNFVPPKHIDSTLGPGYDYDVCNTEILLTRLGVKNGRIILPDGMSYRLLVLPRSSTMPVEVLAKLKELVKAGATVVGEKPVRDPGLKNYPRCDEKVKAISDALWGDCDGVKYKVRKYGKGRIINGISLRDLLLADGIVPDCECSKTGAFIDWIHRSIPSSSDVGRFDGNAEPGAEIYFLANRNNRPAELECLFRVTGKNPEIWDPVTGKIRLLSHFSRTGDGRTVVPLEFAPHQSLFMVFKAQKMETNMAEQIAAINSRGLNYAFEVVGPWNVTFAHQWGGPENTIVFERLVDWTKQADSKIKYYSGKANYKTTFDADLGGNGKLQEKWPSHSRETGDLRYVLDLGEIKDMAHIHLNGNDLGTVWTDSWQVDITEFLKKKDNVLEIDVVNLWNNRLIGDMHLTPTNRITSTNIRLPTNSPLMPAGLLGPVRIFAGYPDN